MAGERRTRAEKARAQVHRHEAMTYSFRSTEGVTFGKPSVQPSQKNPKTHAIQLTDLFAYDVRLIYHDLRKTVIITGIILAAVIGLKVGLQ